MSVLHLPTVVAEMFEGKINPDIFLYPPRTQEEFETHYLPSKLWRLNNLYTIIDKKGDRVRFRMNYAQLLVYKFMLHHPRLLILKSRQQGISTFFLICFMDDAIFVPNLSIGMMAQGESEASTLLRRVKLAWGELSGSIKAMLKVALVKDNTKELGITNDSTIFIRTSFRSTTLQRLHISELGKIANENPKRAEETITGTLQAIQPGNPVAIESTAEGDNKFKEMWDTAVEQLSLGTLAPNDFYPLFLSWLDDPDCVAFVDQEASIEQERYFTELEKLTGRKLTQEQRNFWITKYRELGESIKQEYPATAEEAFSKVKDGTYYLRLYNEFLVIRKQIRSGLHDPMLPVHTVLDLGIDKNDQFVMLFFQVFAGEARVIHEYYNTGEGLAFYVEYIRETSIERGWKLGTMVCPHDINVTELGSGKTRKARLQELGVEDIYVVPKYGILDGIEGVRKLFPKLYVEAECTYLLECLRNYSKEWDESHKIWKPKPLHNKYSHGADALRYIAMSGLTDDPWYEGNDKDSVVDGLSM